MPWHQPEYLAVEPHRSPQQGQGEVQQSSGIDSHHRPQLVVHPRLNSDLLSRVRFREDGGDEKFKRIGLTGNRSNEFLQ